MAPIINLPWQKVPRILCSNQEPAMGRKSSEEAKSGSKSKSGSGSKSGSKSGSGSKSSSSSEETTTHIPARMMNPHIFLATAQRLAFFGCLDAEYQVACHNFANDYVLTMSAPARK